MKTEVTLTAMGMGEVPKGLVLVLQDGRRYIVKKQRGVTLTLVPMRWWHRFRWRWVFAFALGAAVGQLLWRFW